MIYIVKKSKKTDRLKKYTISLDEAKEYILNLKSRDFLVDNYFIYTSDHKEELEDLLSYFTKDYLIPTTQDMMNVYMVNEKVHKYHRLSDDKGITQNALDKFMDKIRDKFPDYRVDIIQNKEDFEIIIEHENQGTLIICDYSLEIKNAFGITKDGEYVDVLKTDEIVKMVNNIFRKQRYYYKKKVRGKIRESR